jgi:LuxR family maltose regulon positive regulatory protein
LAEGAPAFSQISDGCGIGCEYEALAEFAIETGSWEEAELYSFKAIYKAKTKEQTSIAICACFTLMRLYILQGKASQALTLLEQLNHDVAREHNAIYNTTFDLCAGYIYACLKQFDKIPSWLQTGEISTARFMYNGMAFNYIVYSKAILLTENWIKLEVMCESFKEYYSIFHNQLGFLHNEIYNAIAKHNLYGMEAGKAALQNALAMGAADGILMPFAESCNFILPVLTGLAGDSAVEDSYIGRVISCCRQYGKSLKFFKSEASLLSKRETEVLRLLAQGLSRDEIAAQLYLSVSSVKTYLQHIYLKLEVNNKMKAVQKATELKII